MKRGLIFCGLMVAWLGSDGQSSMGARTAIATNLPDNATKTITPALLRTSLTAMVDLVDLKVSSQWTNLDASNIRYLGNSSVSGSFMAGRMEVKGSSPILYMTNSNAQLQGLTFQNNGLFSVANTALQINTADGRMGIGMGPTGTPTSPRLSVNGNIGFGPSGAIDLQVSLDGKASQAVVNQKSNIASPTFTGVVTLPVTTIEGITIGTGNVVGASTGATNTVMGKYSSGTNTTGHSSVIMGFEAYQNNTTGSNNIAIGRNAMISNVEGYANVAVGGSALNNNNANANTGLGYQAMYNNTSGTNNTAIGSFAGLGMTTGSHNVVIGTSNTSVSSFVKLGITTGSYNTILGANVSGLAPGTSNNIILADGQGNRRINVDAVGNVGIGTNNPTAKLEVNGNAKISGNLNSTNRVTASEMVSGYLAADVLVLGDNLAYAHPSVGLGKVLTSDAVGNASWGNSKYTKTFNKPINYFADSIVVNQSEHLLISPEVVTMRSETGVMMLPYKINSTSKRVVVYFNKDKAYKGSFTIF